MTTLVLEDLRRDIEASRTPDEEVRRESASKLRAIATIICALTNVETNNTRRGGTAK